MVFALLGKAVWGTAKFGVKHLVIPILISMATAAVLQKLTERVEERTNHQATLDPAMVP